MKNILAHNKYGILLKNFFFYGMGVFINKAVQFVFVPLYTRLFTPDEYAAYDIISSMSILLYLFGLLQLESGLGRFYFETSTEADKKKLFSTLFFNTFLLSLLTTFIAILFGGQLSYLIFKTEAYKDAIRLAAVNILFFNLLTLLSILVRFKGRTILFLFGSILQTVSTIGFSLLFVMKLKFGINGAFLGLFVGTAIAAIFFCISERQMIKILWVKNISNAVFKYSLPSVPAIVLNWLNSYATRFMMLRFLSMKEVGIYSAVVKIAGLFLMFDFILRMIWYPFFWENYKKNEDHRNLFVSIVSNMTIVIFAFLSIFILFSESIYTKLTAPAYWDSYKLLGFLCTANVLYMFNNMVALGPDISKKTYISSLLNLFAFFVNVLMFMLLAPGLGATGVAISFFITNFLMFILSWMISEHLYKIGYSLKRFLLNLAFPVAFSIFNYSFVTTIGQKVLISLVFLLFMAVFHRKKLNILYSKLIPKSV